MATQATLTLKIWRGAHKSFPPDLSDIAEMFAPHLEHVSGLCDQGYQSGQICDEKFTGWWSIETSTPRRKRRPKPQARADHATPSAPR